MSWLVTSERWESIWPMLDQTISSRIARLANQLEAAYQMQLEAANQTDLEAANQMHLEAANQVQLVSSELARLAADLEKSNQEGINPDR